MTEPEFAEALAKIQADRDAERAAQLAAAVMHIRRRMPKVGGNQYYRARVNQDFLDRNVKTFCGAEPTEFDYAWSSRNFRDTKATACQACVTAVIGEGS